MNKSTPTLILIGAGAIAAFIAYRYLKGGLKAAAEAVNPLSDKNIAYQGVNAVGAAVTGDKAWTLGGAIYDLVHGVYDPNAPAPTNRLWANSDVDGRPSAVR